MSDPGLEREDAEYLSALEAALRALVAVEPLVNEREDSWRRCLSCDGEQHPSALLFGQSGSFVHGPDCPWLTARTLLGTEPPPRRPRGGRP